ncbi:MAG TPA: diguanylate cyclase [Phycisphaerae bacterium]|nr:diguanylate cyclase [Phycisphaerae bacterium]
MENCTAESQVSDSAALEQKIRVRINSLSYLPTTVGVAMKFVELGKNIEADPADYAKVISSDTSLSTKLLALANSPWFGVRNKVTSVKLAVNLLGLGTVRTLSISYCMAGLHNSLRLKPEDASMFWEASLCRAVAARQTAMLLDPAVADEAFVGGMFQDFALPIMYAVAPEPVLAILRNPKLTRQEQLQKERALCRLDHMEFGRVLAQKMDLPEVFVDAVAFHHHPGKLTDFMEKESLGKAIYASSLFPPLLQGWSRQDADELCRFLVESCQVDPGEVSTFFWKVQEDFTQMHGYFEGKGDSNNRLAELLIDAAREEADNTTALVRTVNELLQDAARMGLEVSQLVHAHNKLEDKAQRDPLTGLLNREGLDHRSAELLKAAARYKVGFAVVMFDVDNFKLVNDNLGHEFGDRALKLVAERMTKATRQQDVAARVGGDEFVMMIYDCGKADAARAAQRILDHVSEQPIGRGKCTAKVSLSAGLVHVEPSSKKDSMDALLAEADKLMYLAKRSGGDQVSTKTV